MALMLGLPSVVRADAAPEVKAAIAGYSALYGLPESLVHRIVKRESKYNPKAYHSGHYGLMQIRYDTARVMGYRGPAKGLLDVDANLKYGVKYLAGAYLVSGGNADKAARYYRSGYYYVAKRKGLLEETGLKTRR
ncbi:MAG: transglycosylase SLT domain-containing protein [Parvibaculaceae bacterium]